MSVVTLDRRTWAVDGTTARVTTVRHMRFDARYHADPSAVMSELANDGPIHRFTAPHRVSGWMVTRFELAKTALTHPDLIKTPETMVGIRARGAPKTLRQRMNSGLSSMMLTHMLASEPPDHKRLRRAAEAPFTPPAIAERIPRITTIADTLVDSMDPTGPVDMVAALAVPLPIQVISEILGIPVRHSARIGRSSRVLGDVLSSGIGELNRAAWDFSRVILTGLASRRFRRREDLFSTLIDEIRDGTIRIHEAASIAALLLIAGHETTTSLIANTLLNLLSNPAELDRVRTAPEALTATIEETLRIDPPQSTTTLRIATRPLTLGGQQIAAGEWVIVSLLSVGHDPDATAIPGIFDSTRKPQRSLPFGHGIHFCLGAQLARTEARIALTRLLTRYPDITLATQDHPTWRPSVQFHQLSTLPVMLR